MSIQKIVIADPERNFIELLQERIDSDENMGLIGTADDGFELLKLVRTHDPDVLIMDISLKNGLALFPYIRHRIKSLKILVISALLDDYTAFLESEYGVRFFDKASCRADDLIECMAEEIPRTGSLNRDKTLDAEISALLRHLGVPAHIKGYSYLRTAIKTVVINPESMRAVTKNLYPDIAKLYATTAVCVERAMRNAIEVAWSRGNVDCLQNFFGYTVNPHMGRPTNSAFIATVADMICLQRDGNMMLA